MKNISKLLFSLCSVLLCLNTVLANGPITFVGPTARGGLTGPITDSTAYSIAGEVGVKNYRVGGTLGWSIVENQRIKLTAEYLWQKINYAFFSGDSLHWVNQGAVGLNYQYEFLGCNFKPQLDLTAYYSHAPSKGLGTRTEIFFDNILIDKRRIAGSNAKGISPGFTMQPWRGGVVGVDLNYDNVRYNRKFTGKDNATGLGGTIRLGQAITDCIGVGISAAMRKPFNDYQANLTWSNMPFMGHWIVGLFGGYVVGKESLPNTFNVGLRFDYVVNPAVPVSSSKMSLKGEKLRSRRMVADPPSPDFLAWMADPAVHMPQVLAAHDEDLSFVKIPTISTPAPLPPPMPCPPGSAPAIIGSGIPDQNVPLNVPTNIDVSSFFSGSNLTYSISPSPDPLTTVSINQSGIISVLSVNDESPTFPFTVTVSNNCGSVSDTFNITIVA